MQPADSRAVEIEEAEISDAEITDAEITDAENSDADFSDSDMESAEQRTRRSAERLIAVLIRIVEGSIGRKLTEKDKKRGRVRRWGRGGRSLSGETLSTHTFCQVSKVVTR